MADTQFLAIALRDYYLKSTNAARDINGASGRSHLKWMLNQVAMGHIVGEKAHRWLGFVQGALVAKGLASVPELSKVNRTLLG